jgi:hypothetical protein
MKNVPKLSPEQEAGILEEMRAFQKKRNSIPPAERFPISNPEKYNFPLGIGPDGEFFPDMKSAATDKANHPAAEDSPKK